MKYTFILFAILSINTFCTAQSSITGEWFTGEKNAKVEIYQEGDIYQGKIVWLEEPTYDDGTPKKDKQNPKAKLQDRPIIGLNMLKGFTKDDDVWKGGTIYDPNNGKSYKCTMWLEDGKLKVRGYVGIFYRTEQWTRS